MLSLTLCEYTRFDIRALRLSTRFHQIEIVYLSNPHQLFKQELIVNDCNIGVKGLQATGFASFSFFLSVVLVITKGSFAFVNLFEHIRSE